HATPSLSFPTRRSSDLPHVAGSRLDGTSHDSLRNLKGCGLPDGLLPCRDHSRRIITRSRPVPRRTVLAGRNGAGNNHPPSHNNRSEAHTSELQSPCNLV